MIALLDLRLRRRACLGYALGLAGYVLIIVALYPTFAHETSLDRFTDSKVAALFGASGTLTSPSGWLNANVYGNFLPLIVLVLTMGYGAACVAGQDADGTLGLVATLPVSRRRLAGEKLAALCVQPIPAAMLSAALVLAGPLWDLHVGVWPELGITLAALLLGIDFGILAMLVGALTGSRGTALGVASAVAAASYLISSLAPVTSWVRPARFVSLFYWSVGNGQLVDGPSAAGLVVLTGVGVALAAIALHAFDIMDVH